MSTCDFQALHKALRCLGEQDTVPVPRRLLGQQEKLQEYVMNSPWIYRLRFPGIEQRKVLTLMGGVRDDFNRILNLRPEFSRQRRESVAGGHGWARVQTGPGQPAPFGRGALPGHARCPQCLGAEQSPGSATRGRPCLPGRSPGFMRPGRCQRAIGRGPEPWEAQE